MADQWYYAKGGKQHGPVADEAFRQMAAAGQLAPTDMVWKDGMPDWKPAREISGLLPPPAPRASSSGLIPVPTVAQTAGEPAPAAALTASAPIAGITLSLPRLSAWQLLALLGSGLLMASFVVPWWGLALYKDDKADFKDRKLMGKTLMADFAWQFSHGVDSEELNDELGKGDTKKASAWIMGWRTTAGVLGLLCGPLVLFALLGPMYLPSFTPHRTLLLGAATSVGVLSLALALSWVLGAPGRDVASLMAQGNLVGPYLQAIAAAMVAAGAGHELRMAVKPLLDQIQAALP